MSLAFLSLGSNLGDRRRHLGNAVRALEQPGALSVARLSRIYETEPVGPVAQPDFLNLVAELRTELEPRALLARCLEVENALGRVRAERWGPRIIDVDLLWFDGRVLEEPDLIVPHPRMTERAFVLVPLAEIAPDLPLKGGTASELAARLSRTGPRVRAIEMPLSP